MDPTFALTSRSPIWSVRSLFLINGFLFANWASRIPAVETHFDVNHQQLGMLLLVLAGGAFLAMPLTGLLIARWGSRRTCLAAVYLHIVSLAAVAWTTTIPSLAVALFGFGVGHGMLDVAMNVQASLLELRSGKRCMSQFHALWSVGGILGAGAGILATFLDIEISSHFLLITVAVGLATPLGTQGLIAKDSLGAPETAHNAEYIPLRRGQLVRIGCLGIAAFCIMMGEGAMADWSAVYLTTHANASETIAAAGYGTFAVAMTVGRFLGDRLIMATSPAFVLRANGIVALVGILLLVLGSSVYTAVCGLALVGLGFSVMIPSIFSAAGSMRGIRPSTALSAVSTIGYLGFLVGPPLLGLIGESVGLQMAFAQLIVTTSLAIALAFALQQTTTTKGITEKGTGVFYR